MLASASRDLTTARSAIEAWLTADLTHRGVAATDLDVDLHHHTGGGYSNEIFFVTATYSADGRAAEERLVLRLPPAGAALFADYDLEMQVAVQDAVGEHGVPVPRPVSVVTDLAVLGTPFLVMPRIDGHDPGELPVVNDWIGAATPEQQRALHERFLDALARIHTTPWQGRPVATHLRGATGTLLDEVVWWEDLARWIFDGAVPAGFVELFTWCREHLPTAPLPAGVLWGDVRLGNVVFDDDYVPLAFLDWEMASIGPAELDIAWYTALEGMTEHFFGRRVDGFLTRDELVARHEAALGRPLVDLAWFEIFALARSSALQLRADRLEADRRGKPPRPAENHAVLAYAVDALRARS